MEYMSAREAANKWGISQRRVAVLCTEKRISGASMVGNMWNIPRKAEKPIDARRNHRDMSQNLKVKPFLKWAGGKGQLLPEIEKNYPFDGGHITRYVEPFVGGGAVLFDILNKFQLDEIYINDINAELINTYIVVRDNIEELLVPLKEMEELFLFENEEGRKNYYIIQRSRFNGLKTNADAAALIEKAALMIFLNRTCFNGLYRVNKNGQFNVPMGAYKRPQICDENNLRSVSEKLRNVTINCGDYRECTDFIDSHTFVYLDPPYRPISNTSNFTAYTQAVFNDNEQVELANFASLINQKGAKFLMSNSDPKNLDSEDDFFDDLYSFCKIKRVDANRMINSNSSARGKIKELLISNF